MAAWGGAVVAYSDDARDLGEGESGCLCGAYETQPGERGVVVDAVSVLGAVAGIGLGSWLIVALAVVVAVVGVLRWRRTEDSYPAPRVDEPSPAAVHDTVLSSIRPNRSDEESR